MSASLLNYLSIALGDEASLLTCSVCSSVHGRVVVTAAIQTGKCTNTWIRALLMGFYPSYTRTYEGTVGVFMRMAGLRAKNR